MSQIFYYSKIRGCAQEDSCVRHIRRFGEFVALKPLEVPCNVQPVPKELIDEVEGALDKSTICEVADEISWVFQSLFPNGAGHISNLVVLCDADDRLANMAKLNNEYALDGGAIGRLAVVYNFEPVTIWHEMFHLLGADDCYDTDNPSVDDMKCGEPNCIMRYSNWIDLVGDPPFICDENVERIRRHFRLD